MKIKILFWSCFFLMLLVLVGFGIFDFSVSKENSLPLTFFIAFIVTPGLIISYIKMVADDYQRNKLLWVKGWYYLNITLYMFALIYGKATNAWIGNILLFCFCSIILALIILTVLYMKKQEEFSIKKEILILLVPLLTTVVLLK